jgi:hypothetical protein
MGGELKIPPKTCAANTKVEKYVTKEAGNTWFSYPCQAENAGENSLKIAFLTAFFHAAKCPI